jgi:hypothetical protein
MVLNNSIGPDPDINVKILEKFPCRLATTENLAYTPAVNMLTNTSVGAVPIDGVAVELYDRILVKNQTDGTQNGIYKVTALGDGSTALVLTRAQDANNNALMRHGINTRITAGTKNSSKVFILENDDPIVLNTTELKFITPYQMTVNKEPCRLATTVNIDGAYSSITKTLINGMEEAVSIDGVAVAVNDRILVKNQTTETQNGIYDVTTLGDVSTKLVLTRSHDADRSSFIKTGMSTIVTHGDTNHTEWIYIKPDLGDFSLDSTNLTFVIRKDYEAEVELHGYTVADANPSSRTVATPANKLGFLVIPIDNATYRSLSPNGYVKEVELSQEYLDALIEYSFAFGCVCSTSTLTNSSSHRVGVNLSIQSGGSGPYNLVQVLGSCNNTGAMTGTISSAPFGSSGGRGSSYTPVFHRYHHGGKLAQGSKIKLYIDSPTVTQFRIRDVVITVRNYHV